MPPRAQAARRRATRPPHARSARIVSPRTGFVPYGTVVVPMDYPFVLLTTRIVSYPSPSVRMNHRFGLLDTAFVSLHLLIVSSRGAFVSLRRATASCTRSARRYRTLVFFFRTRVVEARNDRSARLSSAKT